MTSLDQHLGAGASAVRGTGLRWSPPPVPVLIRIPRLKEEPEYRPEDPPQAIPSQRHEFRFRVGLGVGVLMLLVAIPWLIRWRVPVDGPVEVSPPVVAMETDSDIEMMPPLYAQTASNPSACVPNLDSEMNGTELVESLTAPHPAGVRQ